MPSCRVPLWRPAPPALPRETVPLPVRPSRSQSGRALEHASGPPVAAQYACRRADSANEIARSGGDRRGADPMKRKVVVNDKMQRGYVYYRTEPVGRNFAPEFRPELTPKQMLRLGVFGGKYMTDCRGEFPADWFTRAKLSPERRDPALNYFKVNASQSLAV